MRIGIIGCGRIAAAHARGYQDKGLRIAACYDVNQEQAQRFAGEQGAQAYDSEAALLAAVDAISICTPPAFHADTACAALANNIHVLCEKPLAADYQQALRIQEAAVASQANCMVAFRHRFLPAVQKMKQLIDDDAVGPVIWFKNTFCAPAFHMADRWFSRKSISGGGTLMDTTIHSVDIFRYLFGDIAEQHLVRHQHLAGIDVEDSSILNLKSHSGVLGTCLASWVAGHKMFHVEIMGQNASLSYAYDDVITRTTKDTVEQIAVEQSDGFSEEIAHFINAIQDGTAVSVDYTDGLAALKAVLPREEVPL